MRYKKTYRERIDRGDYAWRVVCYLERDEKGLTRLFQWKHHRYGTILAAMAAKRDIERDMRRYYPNVVARILHNYPASVCQSQYDSSTGPYYETISINRTRRVQGKNVAFYRNEVHPFAVTRPDKLTKVLNNLSNNPSAFSNQG